MAYVHGWCFYSSGCVPLKLLLIRAQTIDVSDKGEVMCAVCTIHRVYSIY